MTWDPTFTSNSIPSSGFVAADSWVVRGRRSGNYLTDPIGVDNLADAFSYTHQLYDAIILDGAEKTRFLTNISCVETEGVSFTADLPLLAKHHTGGDSRHEHAQVQQSYR